MPKDNNLRQHIRKVMEYSNSEYKTEVINKDKPFFNIMSSYTEQMGRDFDKVYKTKEMTEEEFLRKYQ